LPPFALPYPSLHALSNMSFPSHYYRQQDEGGPWERHQIFYHQDIITFDPVFFYGEYSIKDHMGFCWHSAADVLHYLLTHKSLRHRMRRAAKTIPRRDGRAMHITHPLLKLPLYIYRDDKDEDFCQEIRRYLELKEVYKWTV
jgi:hypothetical protein